MSKESTPSGPRDSRSWWAAVKLDPAALRGWLLDQYRGESTAAGRIERLRDEHGGGDARARRLLTVIASQERRHAAWVADLLRARGVEPAVLDKPDRYWGRALPGIRDLATGCAVGAHAERMRLERIEAIASDPDAPADIRGTFARILREERFHERAFRGLAGPAALAATREAHDLGREALGLAPLRRRGVSESVFVGAVATAGAGRSAGGGVASGLRVSSCRGGRRRGG